MATILASELRSGQPWFIFTLAVPKFHTNLHSPWIWQSSTLAALLWYQLLSTLPLPVRWPAWSACVIEGCGQKNCESMICFRLRAQNHGSLILWEWDGRIFHCSPSSRDQIQSKLGWSLSSCTSFASWAPWSTAMNLYLVCTRGTAGSAKVDELHPYLSKLPVLLNLVTNNCVGAKFMPIIIHCLELSR